MRKTPFFLPLAITLLVPTSIAVAHMGAKGVVKERMEAMKSMGKAMKSMGMMTRGKIPLDATEVARNAGAIAGHGERITILFPERPSDDVSEASPRIWQDPEGFKKSADRLVQAARTLQSAATINDRVAIRRSFRALGKTCGGCHKQFRIKKK